MRSPSHSFPDPLPKFAFTFLPRFLLNKNMQLFLFSTKIFVYLDTAKNARKCCTIAAALLELEADLITKIDKNVGRASFISFLILRKENCIVAISAYFPKNS